MIPGAFIARPTKKWSRHDGVRMGTVVITGAAGFVGFHACVRLMSLGHKVVGVDNLGPLFFPSLKHARLEALQKSADFVFHKLDLADHGVFEDLVAQVRPDVIIHLAAQTGVRYSAENPGIYVKNNVEAFTNVLQAARLNSVPGYCTHHLPVSMGKVMGSVLRLSVLTSLSVFMRQLKGPMN